MMIQNVSVRGLLRSLTIILACLFLGSLVTQGIGYMTGHRGLLGLTTLANIGGEATPATWFNSFLLLLVCWVCRVVMKHSSQTSGGRFYWGFLSVLFLLMSIDEVACVHEAIGRAINVRFLTSGLFYFGFSIPGLILAFGVFIFSLRFLGSLPKKTAAGMMLSGFLYLLGASGLDAISGAVAERQSMENIIFQLLTDFEELLEMGSLILFLKVLFEYLKRIDGNKSTDYLIRFEF